MIHLFNINKMITVIQLLTAILIISFVGFILVQIRSKILEKKSAVCYEIIIVNLILIVQLTDIYKRLIKSEKAENMKTVEVIRRKPGF